MAHTSRCSHYHNLVPKHPVSAGPLPLLFVDALFKSHPDPTLRPRAVALISFYLLAWSPLFWNYGYRSDPSSLSSLGLTKKGL